MVQTLVRNFRHRAELRADRGKKTKAKYFALVEDFTGGFQLERPSPTGAVVGPRQQVARERTILVPTARGYETVGYLEGLER